MSDEQLLSAEALATGHTDVPVGAPSDLAVDAPIGDDDDVRRKPTIESCDQWTMPDEDALELPPLPTARTSRDGERNPVAKHRAGLGKLIQAERQKQADEAKARLDIHGYFAEFCTAARALKQAETAFKAAQIAYAEAVKKLSEEAVR